MGLFLSIYKRQVLIVTALLIGIVIFSVFSISEASMFMLIAFGVVLAAYGISTIVSHLSTPSAFRSCDFKFFKGIFSLIISTFCIVEFIHLLIK